MYVFMYYFTLACFSQYAFIAQKAAKGAGSKEEEGYPKVDLKLMFLPVRGLELILIFLDQPQFKKHKWKGKRKDQNIFLNLNFE